MAKIFPLDACAFASHIIMMNTSVNKSHLYFVIPVLNERENLDRLLENLNTWKKTKTPDWDMVFIFVDDGSKDDTAAHLATLSKTMPIVVLKHATNQGPGAAFATAFSYLHDQLKDQDWVITMEGDNTSSLNVLDKMLTRRLEGYNVVLASPYLYGGGILGVSTHRIFLSHCANFLAKVLLGLRGFQTLSSFFRLYHAPTILKLQHRFGKPIIEYNGFECMVELLQKLVIIEASISEVEMSLDWRQRKGKSKMKIFKALRGYTSLLISGFKWRNQAENFWKPLHRSSKS